MKNEYKYHYFYKITNTINNKFYYGIHSTNNLNDNYLGSGTGLNEDKKKYGKSIFKKEILKYFKTRCEASEYEHEKITEDLVHDTNCYNIKIGGDYGTTAGTILVIDKDGVMHRCTKEDSRYVSGEWKPSSIGKVPCIIKETNECVFINSEEFKKNRDKYVSYSDGFLVVKDKNGRIYRIKKDDERYKNGELIPFSKGIKMTDSFRKKVSIGLKGKGVGANNSQYGTCWVHNDIENKRIKLEELKLYLKDGWVKGLKMCLFHK